MTKISLVDALTELRKQLADAIQSGEGENLRFGVKNIELELVVEVSKDIQGEAKANWWVLELGAESKVGLQRTHTVKLALSPVDLRSGSPKELVIRKEGEVEFE